MLSFGSPEMFALIVPVLLGGLFLMRKGGSRMLILSRMLVLSLLITALASPFAITSDVSEDETPSIVIISDETTSMDIFKSEVADRIYESLTANTPTNIIRLYGDSSALGDALAQYSRGDEQIVLVTDGNNNFGKDLEEAFKLADQTGTTIYSVEPEVLMNDISVQITGDKTVVIGNENQFDVVVSQAKEDSIRYSFKVYAGDELVRGGTFTQDTRSKTIRVPYTFNTLGSSELKVELTPLTEDWDDINNVFYKSIYVVPKPNIRLITDDTSSPLGQILFNLYDTSYTGEMDQLDNKKALVLDNRNLRSLAEEDVDILNDYILDGNGLVVVGGERAYDNGDYLNSSFEKLLPVRSEATDWKGGRSIVLVLDVSQSTFAHDTLSDILGNAIYVLRNENLRDAYAGVIAFGSEGEEVSDGLIYLGAPSNLEKLEGDIQKLAPGATSETSLNEGLEIATEWLENEAGEMDIIIISDGGIEKTYDESLVLAEDIYEADIDISYIHITSGAPSQIDDYGNYYAKKLIQEIYGITNVDNKTYFPLDKGERANLIFEEPVQQEEEEDIPQLYSYPLVEYNPRHFITRDVVVAGNITGYNDVTPKPGADRVVVTATGKPVITTWRYGLGRVAAISTDNGKGEDITWASQMYSGNNSRLISATMNWAIGNPQVEEGTVVEAEDTWFGTPATLDVTSYEEGLPVLKFNGQTLELAVTGRNTYQTTVDPGNIGLHDVSGYPIAVNYALEYRDVGINEDLPVLIRANGGKTYTEQEALALLLEDAQKNSLKSVQVTKSQKIYFIIAALVLFLLEICIRRIREIRASRSTEP